MSPSSPKKRNLAQALERDLLHLHKAAAIGGADLRASLGYKTAIAFRVAISRGKVGVPLFRIPGRRGYWCLVKDISIWLAEVSEEATEEAMKEVKPKPMGSR